MSVGYPDHNCIVRDGVEAGQRLYQQQEMVVIRSAKEKYLFKYIWCDGFCSVRACYLFEYVWNHHIEQILGHSVTLHS